MTMTKTTTLPKVQDLSSDTRVKITCRCRGGGTRSTTIQAGVLQRLGYGRTVLDSTGLGFTVPEAMLTNIELRVWGSR